MKEEEEVNVYLWRKDWSKVLIVKAALLLTHTDIDGKAG